MKALPYVCAALWQIAIKRGVAGGRMRTIDLTPRFPFTYSLSEAVVVDCEVLGRI